MLRTVKLGGLWRFNASTILRIKLRLGRQSEAATDYVFA